MPTAQTTARKRNATAAGIDDGPEGARDGGGSSSDGAAAAAGPRDEAEAAAGSEPPAGKKKRRGKPRSQGKRQHAARWELDSATYK